MRLYSASGVDDREIPLECVHLQQKTSDVIVLDVLVLGV
jgi:hypothetical protein